MEKIVKGAMIWIFPLLLAWGFALSISAQAAASEEVTDAALPEASVESGESTSPKVLRKADRKLARCESLLAKMEDCTGYLQMAKAKELRSKLLRTCREALDLEMAERDANGYSKKVAKLKKRARRCIVLIRKGIADQARAANSLRHNGVHDSGGWHYTYYSQNVLPGYGLDIPGRHVGNAGLVMDGMNRVCVASDSHSRGTEIRTPYGIAKVYDCGPGYGTIDVYTNW